MVLRRNKMTDVQEKAEGIIDDGKKLIDDIKEDIHKDLDNVYDDAENFWAKHKIWVIIAGIVIVIVIAGALFI